MFLACLQFCWYLLLIYLLLCNLHVARHTGFLWGVNFLQLFVWDRLNGFLFGKRGREPCSLKVSFGISRAQVLELGLQCWSLPFLCILCGQGVWGGQVVRWFMDSWIHSSLNLVFHCETQPSSIHWLSSPIFPCSSSSSSVPHRWHLHLSPLYDV